MAGTLTTRVSLSYVNGSDSVSISSITEELTIAGIPRVDTVAAIGTTEEALAVGDVAAAGGVCFFRNLDATNYVEVGLTGSFPFRISPGGWAKIECSSLSLYAKANTAAVNLHYMIFSV